MRNHLQNNSGAALLITLALMALLTGVALMAVNRSQTDSELSFNQLHEDQAFYVAEAGAKKAFAMVSNDNSWRDGFIDKAYGNGNYTVTIIDSTINPALGDTLIIRSVGFVQGGKATVEIQTIKVEFNPFKYAMFAKTHVEVKNSFCTDSYNSDSGSYNGTVLDSGGDLGSNGTITIMNMADIGGDVITSQKSGLKINDGAIIAGDTSSNSHVTEIPDIPEDTYNNAELNNNNLSGMSGNFSYNSNDFSFSTTEQVTFTEGVYYFESFNINNGATVNIPPGDIVKIYVRGNIEIKNSGEVNHNNNPANFQLYTTGDLVLKNSGDFYGLVYAPNGSVDLMNSADFYGSIIADEIINMNSACFHYDRSLIDFDWDDQEKMEKVTWSEVI